MILRPLFLSPRSLVAVVTLTLLFGPALTGTGLAACGDNVNGVRVACRCGDSVVSDTHLTEQDPVVRGRCSGDGLFIRAPKGAATITLDLGGLSLIGSGIGTGIRVISGGSEGAVIVGGQGGDVAEVMGFATGIDAHGSHRLKELRGLVVKGNKRDGVRVYGSPGVFIHGVTSMKNGRDGVRMRSRGAQLRSVEARDNAKAGIELSGEGATVQAQLSGNRKNGLVARGRGHDLSGIELGEGEKADIVVRPSK